MGEGGLSGGLGRKEEKFAGERARLKNGWICLDMDHHCPAPAPPQLANSAVARLRLRLCPLATHPEHLTHLFCALQHATLGTSGPGDVYDFPCALHCTCAHGLPRLRNVFLWCFYLLPFTAGKRGHRHSLKTNSIAVAAETSNICATMSLAIHFPIDALLP